MGILAMCSDRPPLPAPLGTRNHFLISISLHATLLVLLFGKSSILALESSFQKKENIIKMNWFLNPLRETVSVSLKQKVLIGITMKHNTSLLT